MNTFFPFSLALALTFTTLCHGQGNEYDLKEQLLAKYMKSVRPVAKQSDTIQVKFEIALRSIVDLQEKNQLLISNVWVRIYWQDFSLVWNPSNYSNITTINFAPNDIWTPDVVLYNSADDQGGGVFEKAIGTNIIVTSKGACSWFCPLIVKTDCAVNIKWFPFDKQTCPFTFGLWTYDGLRVNFSSVRDSADVTSYVPSGEFQLKSIKVQRDVNYYSCCPNVPYPILNYKMVIVRRTMFYLLNLIWPGILIALLAAATFLLPPECGERIGLGITNLLAMTVFLLMVSESIPPTSEAVPLAGQFFIVIMVLSALALLESCIVIKFLNYSDSNALKVPKFIRKFVNVYMARVLLMGSWEEEKETHTPHIESNGKDNFVFSDNGREVIGMDMREPRTERREAPNTRAQTHVHQPNEAEKELASGMREIVSVIKKKESEDEFKAEWRRAIQVVDRLSTLIFFVILIGSCLGLFAAAPRFYVK
eukprot:gene4553-5150_t